MSYVAPIFYFLHAARAPGASVTLSPAAATDFPVYYSYDGRTRHLFKYGSSTANATYTVDRGAAGLEAVDTLIIAAGHNLAGSTIGVSSDDNSAFTSPTIIGGVRARPASSCLRSRRAPSATCESRSLAQARGSLGRSNSRALGRARRGRRRGGVASNRTRSATYSTRA